jgi:hypothetical protein
MTAEAKKEFSEKRGQFWLWTGLLLPPIVWAIQLQTVYLLTENSCFTGNFLPVHITSFASLILSIIGGFISWNCWTEAGAEWKNEQGGTIPRSRFMAILGLMTSALFTLIIFAQWLPTVLGVPCDK